MHRPVCAQLDLFLKPDVVRGVREAPSAIATYTDGTGELCFCCIDAEEFTAFTESYLAILLDGEAAADGSAVRVIAQRST